MKVTPALRRDRSAKRLQVRALRQHLELDIGQQDLKIPEQLFAGDESPRKQDFRSRPDRRLYQSGDRP